jgi:(p)ppGpp synthase/HD superfamily hydrolase
MDQGGAGRQLTFLEHLPLTQRAVEFALDRHGQQTRPGDEAMVVLHLLEVASMLQRSGYPDHVVAAAVLHDVLEDTDAGRNEVDAMFGTEVGAIVALVSDDPGLRDEEERKDDIRERVRRAGGEAAVVYAADKVSKVRELRMQILAGPPDEDLEAKLERHRRSLAMLEDIEADERLVALLRFELEALDTFPPQRDNP